MQKSNSALELHEVSYYERLGITPAMVLALFDKPHDRNFVIHLEDLIVSFIESSAESFEMRPMNSYYRMLCHQIAEYHNLKHVLARKPDNCLLLFKGGADFEKVARKPLLQDIPAINLSHRDSHITQSSSIDSSKIHEEVAGTTDNNRIKRVAPQEVHASSDLDNESRDSQDSDDDILELTVIESSQDDAHLKDNKNIKEGVSHEKEAAIGFDGFENAHASSQNATIERTSKHYEDINQDQDSPQPSDFETSQFSLQDKPYYKNNNYNDSYYRIHQGNKLHSNKGYSRYRNRSKCSTNAFNYRVVNESHGQYTTPNYFVSGTFPNYIPPSSYPKSYLPPSGTGQPFPLPFMYMPPIYAAQNMPSNNFYYNTYYPAQDTNNSVPGTSGTIPRYEEMGSDTTDGTFMPNQYGAHYYGNPYVFPTAYSASSSALRAPNSNRHKQGSTRGYRHSRSSASDISNGGSHKRTNKEFNASLSNRKTSSLGNADMYNDSLFHGESKRRISNHTGTVYDIESQISDLRI